MAASCVRTPTITPSAPAHSSMPKESVAPRLIDVLPTTGEEDETNDQAEQENREIGEVSEEGECHDSFAPARQCSKEGRDRSSLDAVRYGEDARKLTLREDRPLAQPSSDCCGCFQLHPPAAHALNPESADTPTPTCTTSPARAMTAPARAGMLALDANGNLFGTTWQGGANNMGGVYELTP